MRLGTLINLPGMMDELLQDPETRPAQEVALRFGVRKKTARLAAMNELYGWSADDVSSVLRKVTGMKPDLKTFEENFIDDGLSWLIASLQVQRPYWVKAPSELIERSASEGLALCVNAQGELLLRKDGYVAISHVWEEGIQADISNRGIPYQLLQKIFSLIATVKDVNVDWIWLDCVAIPAGHRSLTVHEESMKTNIINSLAAVYERADAVIIVDALVVRLQSDDIVDVAVALTLGKWMTRLWTFQEVKLAKKALVVTGTTTVDFRTMVRGLSIMDDLNTTDAGQTDRSPYMMLYQTFNRLLRNDDGVQLQGIALSCQDRTTGNDIDYARAFFPILGLTWKTHLTREEGMLQIYESRKEDASKLILMHGSPRAFRPGWAPSYLIGLEGEVMSKIEWTTRGLQRAWFTNRVISVRPSKPEPPSLILVLESDKGEEYLCGCRLSAGENQKNITGYCKAIEMGTAFILSDKPVYPKIKLVQNVLLVERFIEATTDEAWVCLTGAVFDIERTSSTQSKKWLILHENPYSDHLLSGKLFTEVTHSIVGSECLNTSSLHVAAKTGEEEALLRLILDEGMSVHRCDSRDWTPLHSAAAAGKASAIRLLVELGADVNASEGEAKTPLILAAKYGHGDAAQALLEAGAVVNLTFEKAWSAVDVALRAESLDTLRLILAAGGDPNQPGFMEILPIITAAWKPVEFLDALLRAGANPNANFNGVMTPIDGAAREGKVAHIKRLLEAGVDVDARADPQLRTPLCSAVDSQHEDAVRILLSHHANPNPPGKYTPIIKAAETGNLSITRELLNAGAQMKVFSHDEGWTPLHAAARHGKRVVVKFLVGKGAELDLLDASGKTALELATENGHDTVVEILTEALNRS